MSQLFADLQHNFERVRTFYPAGSPATFVAAAPDYPEARRARMSEVLRRQNAGWGAGRATTALIERFAQAGTVAVVTGQQAGLFGGPLLTLYKALTAVRLAERLCEQGTAAVPIFWLASQDHDLAEVDHLMVRNADADLVRVEYPSAAGAFTPAGNVRLDATIEGPLAELERCCGVPAPLLRACYQPGAGFTEGFARLLTQWFDEIGLIVFDPMLAGDAAAEVAPTYLAALHQAPEIADALTRRSETLEAAGYHTQVQQSSAATMLFLHRDSIRSGLRRTAHGLQLGDEPIAEAEAAAWITARPQDVSAAALLRPVVQDVYFPTVAQVAGPAESAYLAQSEAIYATLGRRPAAVYPRASATLVDPKAKRILQKYELTVAQCWEHPVAELLARKALPAGIEQRVATMRKQFDTELAALRRELEALDPTLVDATEAAALKIGHQLDQLDGRVARSFGRRNEEVARQAKALAATVYPNGKLQERELSGAEWTLRCGADLPQRLHAALKIGSPEHQIIEL